MKQPNQNNKLQLVEDENSTGSPQIKLHQKNSVITHSNSHYKLRDIWVDHKINIAAQKREE
jgi:hypothetical protein